MLIGCSDAPDYTVAMETCSPIPHARVATTCFTYGQKAYFFGGRDSVGTCFSNICIYDASTDQWLPSIATPLSARVNATCGIVGNEVYIGLGFHGHLGDTTSYLRDWWKMNLTTGEWTLLAPYPNRRTDKAVCFTTETDIYVGYGFESNYTRDMFRYHIATNQWDSIDVHAGAYDFPTRSFGGTGAQSNGRFFYGTGYRKFSLDWWGEFLPEGQWVEKSAVPHGGRTTAATTAHNRAIYVIGGHHLGGVGTNEYVMSDILRYNPDKDQWQYIGDIPQPRFNHVAFSIGEYIYVGLGENDHFVPTPQLWRFKDEP